jgi:hypothetical protein
VVSWVSNSTPMIEAAPHGEAFPTGENDETRKCFGLCELYEAQHWCAGVNKNPANSLGERSWLPGMDSNHDIDKLNGICKLQRLNVGRIGQNARSGITLLSTYIAGTRISGANPCSSCGRLAGQGSADSSLPLPATTAICPPTIARYCTQGRMVNSYQPPSRPPLRTWRPTP